MNAERSAFNLNDIDRVTDSFEVGEKLGVSSCRESQLESADGDGWDARSAVIVSSNSLSLPKIRPVQRMEFVD